MVNINTEKRWWKGEDILLLVLLGALLFLPGLGQIPLFDRDEPRFATAAREMWQSGDFIVPRFNGDLRPDKPPLIYWLMSASYSLIGQANELAARLPSAICGTLTLIIVYLMTAIRFGRTTGLLAAIILGTSTLFVIISRMATADATMLLFITTCMALAWNAWDAGGEGGVATPLCGVDKGTTSNLKKNWLLPTAFWLALACGTLTKGVPLFFVLVPLLTLSLLGKNWRWWRNLKPAFGIPLLLLLVLWWVILAGLQTNWELIRQMVGIHFFARIAGPLAKWLPFEIIDVAKPGGGGNDPMSSYSKPPGFYLALVWVTFWPWSILLIPAAFHAVKRALNKTAIVIDPRPYRFLLAWIIPMWLCLELARGKLLHYPLPLYVAISILCADALVQGWHRLTDVFAAKWFAAARWLILTIWIALAAAVLLGSHHTKDPELFWRCIPLAGAFLAAGVAATFAWNCPSWPFATALGWAGALLVISSLVLPGIESIQVSRNVGRAMRTAKLADPDLQLLAIGYEEPSLVFYADHQIRMGPQIRIEPQTLKVIDPMASIRGLGLHPKFLMAVNSNPDPKKLGGLERLQEANIPFRILMERRGFNPANQKPLHVLLITNAPEPPPLPPSRVPLPAARPGESGGGTWP